MVIDYRKLKQTVINSLGIKPSQYTNELKLGSVKEWDSLAHFDLLCTIEEELGVTFKLEEIEQVISLTKIKDVLGRK